MLQFSPFSALFMAAQDEMNFFERTKSFIGHIFDENHLAQV